jgi:hypothetical protein
MSTSHRLVALFARWSYDHWSELNDGSPQAAKMDRGPDGHDHILSASFDHPPSAEEVATGLRACTAELANQDGKSKLVEYAVMDEGAWREFLGEAAKWSREDREYEFPTIRHHGRLESAREYATRSGAAFTPAAA